MTKIPSGDQASEFMQRISDWQRHQPIESVIQFVQSIFAAYLVASEKDRNLIRQAVLGNRSLWNPAAPDDIGAYLATLDRDSSTDLVPALRAWLICISITGGVNWRDTLTIIEALNEKAVLQDVDIRPHVEEIAASADDSDCRGGLNMEMSTRDLILWILHVPLEVNRDELLRRNKQREAQVLAEQQWGGEVRRCPQCSTAFKSGFDLGKCTQCGNLFYASRTYEDKL